MGVQSVERHIYHGMRARVWSRNVDVPTLPYQKPDADPRHVEAVEPSLNVEPNVLRSLILFPFEHALSDSRHCGVMTSLDCVERLGETPVVVVNLWRPLGIRNPCIIPAATEASIRYFSIQRVDIAVPFLNGYSEPAWIGDPITMAAATV
jgi:hypothetical protein